MLGFETKKISRVKPVAADRECDPDLCMQCQWSICGQKPSGTLDCHNMKLRLRQHKRVAMGLSHVAGWGAFAQVPTHLLKSMWPCLQSLRFSCCMVLQYDMTKSKFDKVVMVVRQCLTWHHQGSVETLYLNPLICLL